MGFNGLGSLEPAGAGVAVQNSLPRDGRLRYLGEAWVSVATELGLTSRAVLRVVVEGRHRELGQSTWDDVFNIGREAIVNAFRHSRAKEIEIEIEYLRTGLRVAVRDNGCGIDPRRLQDEQNPNGGIQCMRALAERMEAQFRVWSSLKAGTEVELNVPARVAFDAAC
jgi:signal transduction histidine kinase